MIDVLECVPGKRNGGRHCENDAIFGAGASAPVTPPSGSLPPLSRASGDAITASFASSANEVTVLSLTEATARWTCSSRTGDTEFGGVSLLGVPVRVASDLATRS
jgi:hypothetical protein